MALKPSDCLVVEAHRDSFELTLRRRKGEAHPLAQSLLPRYIRGGYSAVVFIVGGDSVTHRDMADRPLEGSLDVLDLFINECQAANGQALLIKYKEDVPLKPQPGKVSFLLELEGGRAFQEDYSSGRKMPAKLATLRAFYRMGVRSAQLTHDGRNELADGRFDARTGGKLSEFGLAVVREMNRLHMMIGISHLNDESMMDAIESSADPVFASHCNVRAVFDHPRNMTDEQIKALAKRGGVIGIHYLKMMLTKTGKSTLPDFIKHIDYVAQLVGPQCIGFGILGRDAGYVEPFPKAAVDTIDTPAAPKGLEYYEQIQLLIEELSKRSYKDADIQGILGGNYARVMRQVLPARGEDAIW